MKKIGLIVLLGFLSFACEDEVTSSIPLSPVSLTLDLEFKDKDLNAALAYEAITTRRLESDRLGYGGILVINGFGQNIVNLFAYDLACPVEVQRSVTVKPDQTGKATCPKCGAVYNIGNGVGNPISGAKLGLRTYRVYSLGGNKYRVAN